MRRLRLVGLVLTLLAVAVLAGSLVLGLGGEGAAGPAALPLAEPRERVRVEVLNAAGISGMARAATERLRARGFDVVYYGNAPSFGRDTSVVLDRVGDPETARSVAGALGIHRVRTERDSTLYLEVTVVLGRDWAGSEPEPAPPSPRP